MAHTCQPPPITAELVREPSWSNRRWDCGCGQRWVVMKILRVMPVVDGKRDMWKSGVWRRMPDGPERQAAIEAIRRHGIMPLMRLPSPMSFDDGNVWLPVKMK